MKGATATATTAAFSGAATAIADDAQIPIYMTESPGMVLFYFNTSSRYKCDMHYEN
jgi:hypothetical protein